MKTSPYFRRVLPWALAVLLSLATAFGAVKTVSVALERNFKSVLETEASRRALEITAVTMSSNVMGSVAALGLIDQSVKGVARGVTPLDHPAVLETLKALGESYQANGAYLVNSNGIIQSSWDNIGTPLTGVNVKFRPYFQIAMQGKQNVYAAIGTTTGLRSLYFAAPLHDDVSSSAPVIGVAVIRLDVGRVDSVLEVWPGPALLVSPQGVTFASNSGNLLQRTAGEFSAENLKAIGALKQFGHTFDKGVPKSLPFDIGRETVSYENQRYAVAQATVQWNDPNGDWTLVLLGNLDELMPPGRRAAIGGTSGTLVLVLSAVLFGWRRHSQQVDADRERAELELKASSDRLKIEAETKSHLVELSADLQRAATLGEFARKFLFRVTQRLELDYGLFYVLDEQTHRLTPVGGHGALARDAESLAVGQGLVGQCAKDMTPIVISDAADTNIRIVWGEGAVAPKSVILLPVAQAGRLLGVIVLAALRAIDAEKRALLDAIVPMAAMNLEILMRNLGTQRQAETLQKQQTQLQETEAWYRGIIESAPDGMLVADEDGVITLANPHIDSMFGYSKGALVGQKIEVLVPPAVRPRHPGLRESFFQSSNPRAIKELRGVHKDGTEFPVEVGLSRLLPIGGRGLCVCASVRDITERKRRDALTQLLESQARAANQAATLEQALRRCLEGICQYGEWDLSRVVTFAAGRSGGVAQATYWHSENPARFAEFMRVSDTMEYTVGRGEFAGRVLREKQPVWLGDLAPLARGPRIGVAVAAGLRSAFAFPVIVDGEVAALIEFFSGEVREPDSLLMGSIMTVGSQLARLIERDRAAAEVRQNEERLRGLLEGSPAAVTIVTEEGVQVFCNRRLADMLGAPVEAVKLRRSTEFWANPEERVAFLEQFKREGKLDDYEARFRRDDGRIIWVLLNTRSMEQDGRRLLISWMYDITDRKQAEVELKERMDELERFSRLTVDREEKMIQLKEEINSILEQSGKEKRYKVVV